MSEVIQCNQCQGLIQMGDGYRLQSHRDRIGGSEVGMVPERKIDLHLTCLGPWAESFQKPRPLGTSLGTMGTVTFQNARSG